MSPKEDIWKSVFEHALPATRMLIPMHVNLPYKRRVYNRPPEDELMRFETRGRRKKNRKIELIY